MAVYDLGPGSGARWGATLGGGINNLLTGLAQHKGQQLQHRSLTQALHAQGLPNASGLATILQSQPKAGLELLKQHLETPQNESYGLIAQQFLNQLSGGQQPSTQQPQVQPASQPQQQVMQGQQQTKPQVKIPQPIQPVLQQSRPSNVISPQVVAQPQQPQAPQLPKLSLNRNQIKDVVDWARDARNFSSQEEQRKFNNELQRDRLDDKALDRELKKAERIELHKDKKEEKKIEKEVKQQENNAKRFQKYNEAIEKGGEIADEVIDGLYSMRDTRLKGNVAAGNYGKLPTALQTSDSQLYDTVGSKIASRLVEGQKGLPTFAKMKWEKSFKPALDQSPDVQESLENGLFKEAFNSAIKSDLRDKIIEASDGNVPKNLDILISQKSKEAAKELPLPFDYQEGDRAEMDNGDIYILRNRRWTPLEVRI